MSYGLEIYDTDGVTKVVSDSIGVNHILSIETIEVINGPATHIIPIDTTDLYGDPYWESKVQLFSFNMGWITSGSTDLEIFTIRLEDGQFEIDIPAGEKLGRAGTLSQIVVMRIE